MKLSELEDKLVSLSNSLHDSQSFLEDILEKCKLEREFEAKERVKEKMKTMPLWLERARKVLVYLAMYEYELPFTAENVRVVANIHGSILHDKIAKIKFKFSDDAGSCLKSIERLIHKALLLNSRFDEVCGISFENISGSPVFSRHKDTYDRLCFGNGFLVKNDGCQCPYPCNHILIERHFKILGFNVTFNPYNSISKSIDFPGGGMFTIRWDNEALDSAIPSKLRRPRCHCGIEDCDADE